MRGKDSVRTEFTNGQMALAKMIEELGFSVELEVLFPPYRLDIFLPELRVCIEFDGAHTFKKKDRERDEYLMDAYSIPVLRIINLSPKDEVRRSLIRFFSKWADRKDKIKWASEI